jgi:type IV pilus biogenesis protein CpaD/CtpE
MNKNSKKNLVRLYSLILPCCLMVSACSMETKTSLTSQRVTIEQSRAEIAVPLKEINDHTLIGLVEEYKNYGDGPMHIAVTYDPSSKNFTAMHASNQIAHISDKLRRLNVRNFTTGIQPVEEKNAAELVLTYDAVTAHAPQDCNMIPGIEGSSTGAGAYAYGCTIETMLARQIARPRDLMGRGGLAAGDGRREAINVEQYRSYRPNSDLGGYNIE